MKVNRILEAAIGSQEYPKKFIDDKVREWSAEVLLLAKSQPHAAYSTLTHGLSSRWHYVFRTVPNIAQFLQPLEDVICCTLLPAVLGISPPNDTICSLAALPLHWGGLGVFNPTVQCAREYSASVDITGPLSQCIVLGQSFDYFQMRTEQLSRKSAIHLSRQSLYSDTSSSLHSHFSHSLQTALDLAAIRGASAWLSRSSPIGVWLYFT